MTMDNKKTTEAENPETIDNSDVTDDTIHCDEEANQTGEVDAGATNESSAEAMEWESRYKRLQADFDNFRKRTQSEKEQLSLYVKAQLFEEMLPVLDNFERALNTPVAEENKVFMEGFSMIHQNLETFLHKNGLEEIDAHGKEFDPNFHQAVMHGPSDELADNTVGDVLQKGYSVDGKVVRPAMVKVVNNG